MRKSKLEVLKDQRRGTVKQKIVTEDDFLSLILNGPANPTQLDFINSYSEPILNKETGELEDWGWTGAYMGPYGCAKTSTILAKAWMQALYEPGSQILIARANFNDLKDTTYKRMEEMLGRLPPGTLIDRTKDSPMKWTIQPIGDTDQFSTFTFMGLSDGMGGYEFNSGFLDEADELTKARYFEMHGRCRLPGKSNIVAVTFNPPNEDHWLYTEATGLNAKGQIVQVPTMQLFRPRPMENKKNVRVGYYETMRERFPPDMIRRYVEGEWGSTFAGQPVYGEFSRKLHVAPLTYDRYLPLFRFWDFGYRFPVCIWAQTTDEGGLRVLREEMGKDVEIRPFADRCKAITAAEYQNPTNEVVDFGDPAATQKKDTGSTLAHLMQAGINLRFKTLKIDPGIRAIRQLLSRLVNKEPAFQLDKSCAVTIRALEGGYHYPEDGTGDPTKPVKDNYYDHSMDALRYGVTNIFGAHGDDRPTTTPQPSYGQPVESVAYRPPGDSL